MLSKVSSQKNQGLGKKSDTLSLYKVYFPSMLPDTLPQLTLATSALFIFTICAGFVILRGVTRVFISTVIFTVSTYVSLRIWQITPQLSIDWLGKSQSWFIHGLPIAVLIGSYFVIGVTVKMIARPFGNSFDPQKSLPRTLIGTAIHFVFALLPTALIFTCGAALIHYFGVIDEIRASSEQSQAPATFSQQLKSSVAKIIPADWLGKIDPLADSSRVALAKLITAPTQSTRASIIDPKTGKPIPRAIIVADPALQTHRSALQTDRQAPAAANTHPLLAA